MVGGERSLKISAPQLLWFGIDSTLNIFPQTMNELINELTSLLRRLQAQTLPDATPPIGKSTPSVK